MMNWCYNIYATLFWCKRGLVKALFQEDEERKKFEIEIPEPKHPWIYIAAITEDNTEVDVTKLVELVILPGEVLTPDSLSVMTDMKNVVRWEYMSVSTFEVQTISSDGLVNEVKSKAE